MKFRYQFLLSCLLGVAMLTQAVPQAHAQARSLTDTQSRALRYSPSLLAARYNFFAQRSTRYFALSTMLPTVTIKGARNWNYFDTQTALPPEAGNLGFTTERFTETISNSWSIELRQSVFSSGKNFNEYRQKKAEISQDYHRVRSAEQETLRAATTAHVDILRDQAVAEINEHNVGVLRRHYNAAKDRFELGLGNRTDVAQSEARLAEAERDLRSAQTALEINRALYAELTGEWPMALAPPQSLPTLPQSREEALAIAQVENPTLLAARETARIARYRTLAAVGEALPQVNFIASYGDQSNPDTNTIARNSTRLTLEASMPLFRGGYNVGGISGARYAAIAEVRNLESSQIATVREIDVAWNNHIATPSQLRSARQQIVAASIALEGVQQEQALGARTVLDVLDAERELLNARVALVRSERDQIVAAYNLLASVGRLTYDYLGLPSPSQR